MALRIPRKTLFLLVLPVAALAVLLATLQPALNMLFPADQVMRWVVRSMERDLPVLMRIEEVRLKVLPRPSVRMLAISFRQKNTQAEWIHAEALDVRLALLPLLRGEIVPDRIIVKSPVIRIQRDSQGKWLFPQESDFSQPEEAPEESAPLSDIAIREVLIKDASVQVMDPQHAAEGPHLLLQEMDVHLRGVSRQAPIQVKVKGRFPRSLFELNSFSMIGQVSLPPGPLNWQDLQAEADLFISNMPAEVYRPYLSEFLGLHAVSGKMDFKGHVKRSAVREFEMSGGLVFNDFVFSAPEYATRPFMGKKAELGFAFIRDPEMVNVKHLSLTLGEASIWGRGTWTDDFNGMPWYGFSLHATNLSYDGIRGYLPDKLFPSGIAQISREAGSTGRLDIPFLEITSGGNIVPGEDSPESSRRIAAKISFRDFGLNLNSGLPPLESLNGEVLATPDTVHFWNLTGVYGRSRVEEVSGILSLTSRGDTDLKLDARLDLHEVHDLLLRFPELIQEEFFLSRVQRTNGFADVKVRLTSSGQVESPFSLKGSVLLIGGGFSLPSGPFAVSNIHGKLTFEQSRTLPFSLKAKIDGVPANVEGEFARIFSREPSLSLKISARPTVQELSRWVPGLWKKLRITQGVPDLRLRLEGTPDEIRFDTDLDLTQTALRVADWLVKSRGIRSTVHLSGLLQDGTRIFIEQGAWMTAGQSVFFSGEVRTEQDSWARLRLWSDHLALLPWEPIFPVLAGAGPESSLSGNLALAFQPQQEDSLIVNGDISLKNAFIHPRLSPRPLREITGTVFFTGKEVSAPGIRFKWGDLPVSMDLKVPLIQAPEPEVWIKIPFLDAKPLVEEFFFSKKAPVATNKEALDRSRFQAHVVLQEIRHGQIELRDFRATGMMKDGALEIPSFTVSGLDGKGKGKARIDFLAKDQPTFEAEGEISGVSAEKYLQLIPNNLTFYAGRISGSIGVRGALYPDLVETARAMTGQAHLLLQSPQEKGYLTNVLREIIHRVEIIMGRKDALFLILEYDQMGGDFSIRDGKFHSENFYMDQYHKFDVSGLTVDKLTAAVPIRVKYNVKAAGSFDFVDSHIDCYLAAEPFSAATKIMKKVPFAGKVLVGKDESLYSFYYRYHGFTGHEYRGKTGEAELERVGFQDLPRPVRETLSTPGP